MWGAILARRVPLIGARFLCTPKSAVTSQEPPRMFPISPTAEKFPDAEMCYEKLIQIKAKKEDAERPKLETFEKSTSTLIEKLIVPEFYVSPRLAEWTERKMDTSFKESPERDTHNWPHIDIPNYPAKMRLGFLPSSWFDAFYHKTGVTGPYCLLFFGFNFLFSKEIIFIFEHQWKQIFIGIIPILFLFHRWAGPMISKFVDEMQCGVLDEFDEYKHEQTQEMRDSIDREKYLLDCYQNINSQLFEVKKENVALQLEYNYRERMDLAYKKIKRQLDFMAEAELARRRFEQRHMADWIVKKVVESITPEQEKAALNQCILDLRTLAEQEK